MFRDVCLPHKQVDSIEEQSIVPALETVDVLSLFIFTAVRILLLIFITAKYTFLF
jgi:hypothetical protein